MYICILIPSLLPYPSLSPSVNVCIIIINIKSKATLASVVISTNSKIMHFKPAAISRETMATFPSAAAQCNGVLPEKSVHSMLVSGYDKKNALDHAYIIISTTEQQF